MDGLTKENRAYCQVIVEKLKEIEISKIILFGSSAYGGTHPDSDIDLIVVTADDYMPRSYKEKSDIHLRVSSALGDIFERTTLDLIVYTKPMYDKFMQLGSLFSKEVSEKGIVLYEAGN